MKRAFFLLLLIPAIALADYKADYRDGVAAAERQEWAKVEALMRKAIAAQPNPDPKAKIRMYGQRFVPYLPQFYLGLAAFSRNDCATAISLLEGHSNVVKGLREADRQAMMVRTCRAKLGTAVAATTPASPQVVTPAQAVVTAPPSTAAAPKPPVTPPARPVATTAAFDNGKLTSLTSRLDRADTLLSNLLRSVNDPLLAASRANWRRQFDLLA